jgi:hypothetical protein
MLWHKDPDGKDHDEFAIKQRYDYILKNGEPGFGFRRNREKVPSIDNLEISRNLDIADDYDIPDYVSKLVEYENSYLSY